MILTAELVADQFGQADECWVKITAGGTSLRAMLTGAERVKLAHALVKGLQTPLAAGNTEEVYRYDFPG